MRIYVDINAERDGDGTSARPFRHIDDAARIAVADVHDAHMCPRREHPAGVTAHPALGEEPARPRREGAALGEGAKLGCYLGAKAEQPVRVSWNQI